MNPEREAQLAALAQLQAEKEFAAQRAKPSNLGGDGAGASASWTPDPPRSWLESAYDDTKNYGVPAAQLGIDAFTGLSAASGTAASGGSGAPLAWYLQPIASSAMGTIPEAGVRYAGAASDRLFGTNLEPNATFSSISGDVLDNAYKNARTGLLFGGAFRAAGGLVEGGGEMLFNNFNKAKARLGALFDPGTLTTKELREQAQETVSALESQGFFPKNLSRNPWEASQTMMSDAAEREGKTLSSLRREVDRTMAEHGFSGGTYYLDDMLNGGFERYDQFNRVGRQTQKQAKPFNEILEREAVHTPLNMTGITDLKEGFRFDAKNMPSPQTYEGQIYQTFGEVMKDHELALLKLLPTPEKQQQYLASLKLYERIAEVSPRVGQLASELSQSTKLPVVPAASWGQAGPRIFGSLRDFFMNPSAKRLYDSAFNPQSGIGRFMSGPGAEMMIQGGNKVARNAGFLGNIAPEVNASYGEAKTAGAEFKVTAGALLENLTESKPVAISRNLNNIDAASIEALIPAFVETHNAQPLQIQLKRLVAEGDKSRIADFLGQLANKYPDFPIQRGGVTGLPSEFDLGDGFARLISIDDKREYERRVNVSGLDVAEKALRLKDIREQGIAHPLNKPLIQQSGKVGVNKDPGSPYYAFSQREQTLNGSRKVE